ncbi:MAG: tRNA (guanosine(46)-N7)-methyltransferase TrmB [Spiroplasma sp.]|nr:tRNA (guanosine(46)-N7)-methyltransferase TrmB [Spiroplasma sp.]
MSRLKYHGNAVQELAQGYDDVLIKEPEKYQGQWNQLVFKNNHKLYLEIGIGKGDFIIENAKKYHDINFIGIEVFSIALIKAAKKYQQLTIANKPDNLKLIQFDANDLLTIFNQGEIDQIYLNFSDPWPKTRHEKRRLSFVTFLTIYHQILKANGQIHLKTDNDQFFAYSINSFLKCGWKLIKKTTNLVASVDNQNNIETEYEKKFKQLGENINYVVFQKQSF